MKRVLIVNKSGQLSALPSVDEFNLNDYAQNEMITGLVEVSDDVLASIYVERSRVKVLLPELPPPEAGVGWFYVAVVQGVLIKV